MVPLDIVPNPVWGSLSRRLPFEGEVEDQRPDLCTESVGSSRHRHIERVHKCGLLRTRAAGMATRIGRAVVNDDGAGAHPCGEHPPKTLCRSADGGRLDVEGSDGVTVSKSRQCSCRD